MGARLQNRYELGEPLEALEAGAWHRGEDVRSRRPVRIAMLAADAPAGQVAAFERTARLAMKVRHPGIERFVSSGRDAEGHPYLVVDHFPGGALGARLLEEPTVKLHDLLRSLTSVLNGLDIAHKAELVHGGIEPSRLLVDEKLRAQLVGFALHGASGSTPTAEVLPWLAPEVRGGAAPTPASDVYGMGAILYRAVVGEPPEPGSGISLRERRRTLPASLAEAIEKAIAVSPAERPQCAGDLRKELTAAMVGAHGLRSIVVPRAVAREDEDADVTEDLTLADLEEPTPRELVAWTKPKSEPPPLPRGRRIESNRRGPAATRGRPSTWKRSDPPPLPSPSNSASNERSQRPAAYATRHLATPALSSGARAAQARISSTPPPAPPKEAAPSDPAPAEATAGDLAATARAAEALASEPAGRAETAAASSRAPRAAVAVGRVKLVSRTVSRAGASAARLVEVDAAGRLLGAPEPAPVAEVRPEEPAPAAEARGAEPAPAAGVRPEEPAPAAEARGAEPAPAELEDDEPELEATFGPDASSPERDDPELEAILGPAAASPERDAEPVVPMRRAPRVRPWPYPTGGPPGIVRPPVPSAARPSGAMPALAIGLLALGVITAAAGSVRLAASFGESPDGSEAIVAADAAPAARARPRRRAPAPARSSSPAPTPSIATPVSVAPATATTTPAVAAAPAAPAPVVAPPRTPAPAPVVAAARATAEPEPPRRAVSPARRRPRAGARASAPSRAPSMAPSTMAARTLVRDPGF